MNEFKLPLRYNWELAHKEIETIEYYVLDIGSPQPVVNVTTAKGIIEVENLNTLSLSPSFGSTGQFWINNNDLVLTTANRDNIYVQITPYYRPAFDDNFVPYIVPSGFVPPNGLGLTIYNASGVTAGANQQEGPFYIYYELRSK